MLSAFLKIGPFILSGYSFFYLLGMAVGCTVVLVLASGFLGEDGKPAR